MNSRADGVTRGLDIACRMMVERQREIAVSIKALRLMQEHYGNPYYSFKCVRHDEEREWSRKAEEIIPPVSDADVERERNRIKNLWSIR